jgi:3-phenylpropionate/trans-cinnamate dioxygenase ferredoxin reductase component
MQVVIVGAGECGVRAAFSLREAGFDGKITILGSEHQLPYERPPMSKSYATEQKPIRASADYKGARIDLRLGIEVDAIHPIGKQVQAGGEVLIYDKLLIATGARARTKPAFTGCHTLRTADEAASLMPRLAHGQRIGIIGAGFIGLELAATARQAGADVSVFQVGPRVLARAVPHQIADLVADRHRAEGVRLHLDVAVVAADATSITLAGGERLTFDTVIAGIGSVPNVELALQAGLRVENGISVDHSLRTSDPDIFAAGDCCNFSWRGTRLRLESWRAAQEQGAHAAAAMLGADIAYDALPWFWSDQYDLTLQVAGLFDPSLPIHGRTSGSIGTLVFQCEAGGELAAVAGIGIRNDLAKDLRILEKLIERRVKVLPAVVSDPSVALKSLLRAA